MLSIMRGQFLLWHVLLCLAAYAEDAANEEPHVDVCDLARDPMRFSGRTVRLEGEIAFGEHGSGLIDRRCPTVSLGGFTWGNYVCFGGAQSSADSEPIDWAFKLYTSRVSRGKHVIMHGILIGQLLIVRAFDHTVISNGLAWGSGFCDKRASPFKLIVKRAEFLSFRESDNPDSELPSPRPGRPPNRR